MTGSLRLRIGTRGSPLALAQAAWVARRLAEVRPDLRVETVVIVTSGDKFAGAIAPPAASEGEAPNVKAMFVKEIEEALLAGTVDLAVHSAKDLPAELPAGLAIAAYPEREDPTDVYIGGPSAPKFGERKGARIGTSSLRRLIQLRQAWPDSVRAPLRGNVGTRLKRLAEGKVDGLVLAAAGLKRLGLDDVPRQALDVERMVPAPGQGALAIEARPDREDLLETLRWVDHASTRLAVECERAFMKAMGGGCRSPLGAFGWVEGEDLRMRFFWSDPEGRWPVRGLSERKAAGVSPEAHAQTLKRKVLEESAKLRGETAG